MCLWRKYDAAKKCVDEMAIKECIGKSPNDQQDPSDVLIKEGLMTEAVIQRDLNTVRPGGDQFLSFLRQYKYCRSVDTRRLYLEYAPYGDLESLRLKYYVWSEYIPEGFVWHTLISLLEALLELERPPRHDTEWNFEENKKNDEHTYDDYYTLYLDLKPENILLDYETDANPEIVPNLYPSIKVSDFGLSRYVNTDDRILDDYADDDYHPGPGTLGFQPPEQTGWGEYWWGEYSRRTPWTSAHNVWTVGKIVFDLICHTDHNEVDDLMETECPNIFDEGEKIFNRRNGHFMVQNWDPLFTKIQGPENTKTWYYSPKLKDIIRDCLFPAAARRPPARVLLRCAKAGRDTYLKSLDAKHNSRTPAANRKRKRHPLRYTSPAAETRLYFRHSEISAMGKGPMKLDNETQRELYKPLRRGHDPDYPMLRPPPQNWAYLGLVPPERDENNKSVPKMVLKNRATGEILHTDEFDVYFDDHSEGEAELNARYDHGDDSGDDEDGENSDNEHDQNEDDRIAAYDSEIRALERKLTSVRRRRRNMQIKVQQAENDGDDDTKYRKKTKDYGLLIDALYKKLAAVQDKRQVAQEENEPVEQSEQHESGEMTRLGPFPDEMDSEGAISDPALRES